MGGFGPVDEMKGFFSIFQVPKNFFGPKVVPSPPPLEWLLWGINGAASYGFKRPLFWKPGELVGTVWIGALVAFFFE